MKYLHAMLRVRDLDATSKFFTEGLGLHQTRRIDNEAGKFSLVYFAAHTMQTGSGVAITGSHNPPKYNGFKMMMGGRALYGEDVQELARVMNGGAAPVAAHPGTRRQLDLVQAYVARVASGVKLARPMKIAMASPSTGACHCGLGLARWP